MSHLHRTGLNPLTFAMGPEEIKNIELHCFAACRKLSAAGDCEFATSGAFANLAVYLIQQFNVNPIVVAQIVNVVNGSTSIAWVVGAIISDSCLGCFFAIVMPLWVEGSWALSLHVTTNKDLSPQCTEGPS
ncbi:hypothetical protein EJ110_NYTH13494 [Nymphaea thermarum]|nr:hypothetical protein EJ110_NYTH13494 [Nymphaea thermarum]